MCTMTHPYVYHDVLYNFLNTVSNGDQILNLLFAVLTLEEACMPGMIHICTMTHSYVCHGAFLCVVTYVTPVINGDQILQQPFAEITVEETWVPALIHVCCMTMCATTHS